MQRHFHQGELIAVLTTQPLDRTLDYKAPEGGVFALHMQTPEEAQELARLLDGEG